MFFKMTSKVFRFYGERYQEKAQMAHIT